jgi:hypothetical protein
MIYFTFSTTTNVTALKKKQIALSKCYEVLPEDDAVRTETCSRDLIKTILLEY